MLILSRVELHVPVLFLILYVSQIQEFSGNFLAQILLLFVDAVSCIVHYGIVSKDSHRRVESLWQNIYIEQDQSRSNHTAQRNS